MGALQQFSLLLWKNWLLQKRKKLLTFFEIALPTAVALILLWIRSLITAEVIDTPTVWQPFGVDNFLYYLKPPHCQRMATNGCPWQLAYTPQTALTERLMNRVSRRLKMDVNGFDEESLMADYLLLEEPESQNTLGGIVFVGSFSPNQTIPDKVTYKIRLRSSKQASPGDDWDTDRQYDRNRMRVGPRSASADNGGYPGYFPEGFLTLQRALDLAIIQEHNSSAMVESVLVEMQRFPYPPYVQDGFIAVMGTQLPFMIMLSFLILAPSMVKDIVLEKEKKLKESMKLMGLSTWLHWLAWFVKYLIFLTTSNIIITIFFKVSLGNGAVVNTSDGFLLFIILLLYSVSIIMFCFAVSVFFSASNTGAAAGGVLFFLMYLPYFFIIRNYDAMTLNLKLLACLLPNCAMAMGFNLLSMGEATGIGVQWDNFYKRINADEDLTIGHVLVFMIIDSVLAGLITWYVEAVKPGDYGVPKPWYFCFTKWYWCGGEQGHSKLDDFDRMKHNNGETFEETSPEAASGIQIKGLTKEFRRSGRKHVAVNDMWLDMHEGQITALLGHNGAGKTTTMFMLTGFMSRCCDSQQISELLIYPYHSSPIAVVGSMSRFRPACGEAVSRLAEGFLPPTKGTALVNGHDICTNITKVRKNLGLCPQHDILYDNLTVAEHLEFFAKLKECPKHRIKKEVDDMIQLLHLEFKRNAFAKSLSGGMKRKLSVGIALIGGSKVVVLDEPTSGMDPEARRQTWDILQSQRAGRTILLTTHFMDEADYLGDRIAIMASGQLVCCGSSLFLKRKYGVGYHMVMVKEPSCDFSRVQQIITKHVPNAKLESNISAELSFILPHESSGMFEHLFTALETNKTDLGISSFGASVTTMEEVFLKVGEGEDTDLTATLQNNGNTGIENAGFEPNSTQGKSDNIELAPNAEPTKAAPVFGVSFRSNIGLTLQLQQFWGMFIKRVINSWRSPVVSLVQLILPSLFALFACLFLETSPRLQDPQPLTLGYSYFEDPVIPYQVLDHELDGIVDMEKTFKGVMEDTVRLVDIDEDTKIQDSGNMTDYLTTFAKARLRTYINSYLVAATFENATLMQENTTSETMKMKGYFNNEALHTPALALNTIGNTLLRWFTSNAMYAIEVINHPLPKPSEDNIIFDSIASFIVSVFITFGMSFLVATFVVFAIKERGVKAKHSQFVSGVSTLNFWLASFTWDMINFLIPALCIIIIFAAFNIDGYASDGNLQYMFLSFVMYGASVLPFVYIISLIFDVPATGFVWVTIINIFTGIAGLLVVFILMLIEDLTYIGETLQWVFYIFLPNFCFAYSLQEIYKNYQTNEICKSLVGGQYQNISVESFCSAIDGEDRVHSCCPGKCGSSCMVYFDYYLAWDSPGIGRPILFMALQFVGFFCLLFFLESGTAKNVKQKIVSKAMSMNKTLNKELVMQASTTKISHHEVEDDSDVSEERKRIRNTDITELIKSESVVLQELQKIYGNFMAVNRLSIGIKQGECFGLLGINGAGKTTSFKMLTGDETITSGNAYLCGHSVSSEIKKVQRNVGYCPQFDALIEKMTVNENLVMFARLRGVRESDIKNVVNNLITNLMITEYKNAQAGTLSGGNKRKLSTAIALVGDPPVVFLDEPTTGMDPVARRLLWNTLTQVRESGRTIVLTSHNMEECEALCTRIAIMVNGQFKCLGSSQRLKTKFGEGYTLMAKIMLGADVSETEQRTTALMKFIEDEFPGSTLKDLHQGLVMYHINNTDLSWAQIFGSIERAKGKLSIEDYSVSQTTLEQVFINFARAQVPPLEENVQFGIKCKSCISLLCCSCCCSSG